MGRTRRIVSFYVRIARTYGRSARTLLALALVVFVPLALLDALWATVDVESLDIDSGFKVAALIATISAVTATGLLGEVFYSGAAAISLTTPEGKAAPGLREIAGRLRWWRLIGIDLLYVLIVVVGMVLFVVPGIAAFVYLGLSGPIVELERRSVGGALRRSVDLVRGSFWFVFWVLVPIEIVGDAINEGVEEGVHHLLGESFLSTWLSEAAANMVTAPVVAVAAVLLTLHLIWLREGDDGGAAPRRPDSPTPASA